MKILNDCQAVIRMPKQLKNNVKKYSLQINISQSKFIRDAISKEINSLNQSNLLPEEKTQ